MTNNGIRHGKGTQYYANGDVYNGQFVENKRVGKAQLRSKDVSQYIGQFINDEADGHGLYTDTKGNRYQTKGQKDTDDKEDETGHFLKGKLYGKGEIKLINGNTYNGHFKGSLREGYGEMTYIMAHESDHESQGGVYKGNWKRDNREGDGVMKYDDGSKFTGIWHSDTKHYGAYELHSGAIYTGYFKNNQFDGKGKLKLASGLKVEGLFSKGEFTNKGKLIFKDGGIFEGSVIDYEIGDRGILTYQNKDQYEGYFNNKIRNGFGILAYANGDKYEWRWKDNMKSCYGREYIAKTQEYYEGKFERDKRNGDGTIITSECQIFSTQYRSGEKVDTSIVPKVMKCEKYYTLIHNFLKKRSIIDPKITIMY